MFEIFLYLIAAIALCFSSYKLFKAYGLYKDCKRHKMSFAESLNLCDLPVVCFKCDGKPFNMLVDSGANNNVIDARIIESYPYKETNYCASLSGIEGNESPIVDFIEIEINHKDEVYTDKFQVANVSKLFDNIKNNSGVTIHGILGNNFFQKYKYILNFDELTFYHV